MSRDMVTQVSSVPAVVFLLPMLMGSAMLAIPGAWRQLQRWLSVLTTTVVLGLGAGMVSQVLKGSVLTTWHGELRVDALSALMVILIGGVGLFASLYSVPYLAARITENVTVSRVRIFHGLLMWFLGTMLWGCVTNNVVMLYVAIEATTLTSGLLVAFYWNRPALEAGEPDRHESHAKGRDAPPGDRRWGQREGSIVG